MSTADSQLQRDQAWTGDPEEWVRETVMSLLKELHTCMPGIIKSFDAAKQTAVVQPAIKRVFVEDGPTDLPLCLDVPVVFPQGGQGPGGFVLTFPVAPGDECLLHFAERAIDNWYDRGGTQEASEVRFHDLSDGFAVVGVRSQQRKITAFATDAVELRTVDGTTTFRFEGGKVTVTADQVLLGDASGLEPAVLGDKLQTLLDALKTHIHPLSTGTSSASLELSAIPDWDPRASRVKVK